MAQVFHMMIETDYKTGQPIGFTAALRRKGYKYQWEMVVEELRVQARLNVTDPENFTDENLFAELRRRGYNGELRYSRVITV